MSIRRFPPIKYSINKAKSDINKMEILILIERKKETLLLYIFLQIWALSPPEFCKQLKIGEIRENFPTILWAIKNISVRG